jgi:23S rRNA (uracil1939-C5)-methyltransferase
MRRELTISRFGNQGDGIANTPDGPVYVPFTLPGERVVADVSAGRGQLIEILESTPDRIAPICPHFGTCGGCGIQHSGWESYLAWKRQRIIDALSMEGIEAAAVRPVLAVGPHSRRRATFTFEKSAKAVAFGFRRAQSHDLVDLRTCPVLIQKLEAAIPILRELLNALLSAGGARVLVTSCDNGIDVNIDDVSGRMQPITAAMSRIASNAGILRITINGAPVLSLAAPQVSFAGIPVDLPPGAFLQACAAAEAAIVEFAVAAVGKARNVADLYCGLGAFTFTLARKAAVTAAELDKISLAGLRQAARKTQGIKPITAMRRDLSREPLSWMELKPFDAVVFDPPRAGAIEQARALAKSRVPIVVAISCNPVSFAKDARALLDGGYVLADLLPIDQFTYSPHVELAAKFVRR